MAIGLDGLHFICGILIGWLTCLFLSSSDHSLDMTANPIMPGSGFQ
jgi:hypothetical protein